MTKSEFRQAIKRNGLSCSDFAAMVGRDVKTIYSYGGNSAVPYFARLILRLLDDRGGSRGLNVGKQDKNTTNR